MEILASKLNSYGLPSKTPKSTVPKAGITFEQLSAYNKENHMDSGRRDKSNSRIEENSGYQARVRSQDKRSTNNTQTSYNYGRTDTTNTSSNNITNLCNFFNSPKGAEVGEFFKTQDKNSYSAKHVTKGSRTSFKQEEKVTQSALNDQYLQSKIDQIINSSLSLRDKSKNNMSASKIHGNTNSIVEDKHTEKTTLYTRLLNDMRTSTPKSKVNEHARDHHHQTGTNSKYYGASHNNETTYTRGSESKKPYLNLKISGAEPDQTSKIANEEAKALKNFQRMSFSQQKRAAEKEENMRHERVEHEQEQQPQAQAQAQPRRGGESSSKQERSSSSRALAVNTQNTASEPQFSKQPMTAKSGTKLGSRYNDNQAIYESLSNLKKTLERPSASLTRSTTLNGPVYNNFVNNENRESKPIFKSVTPKADIVSSEVKSVLQSFKTVNRSQNEDKQNNSSSINRRTLDDDTYQTYLKERSRNEERGNVGPSSAYHHRPPSSSKSSKYRESSLNARRPEEKTSTSGSVHVNEKEKEKENKPATQKSLKDFITQVNPSSGSVPFKAKLDVNTQNNNERQSYAHLQAQSAKNSTRPGLNDKLTMNTINNLTKTSSTTTNSSVAQESKTFTFNTTLVNKHSTTSTASTASGDDKTSANGTKKEALVSQACQYYMAGLEKYLKNREIESEYFFKIYREHFLQGYQAINFCKYLKSPDPAELAKKKVYLPKKECYKDKKTIIFDLDETLIHCNENASVPSDVILPIKFPHGDVIEAGINVRPYAVECLEELSKHFEIIVFTASHSCYANVVLDHLDPQNKYIQHRLFRENCVTTEEGLYIKDLRIFANRNLKDLVIVDNAMYSFGYQMENGIPIIPFYYHKSDTELKTLVPYLKSLYHVRDVRDVNIKSFKLHHFTECEGHEEVLKKLFE